MAQHPSVLIVEEDPFVRSFVADKLMAMGYVVAATDHTADARQDGAQFDLVLKDLPKPFSLDVLEWRLKSSRIVWRSTPERMAAGA